MVLPGFNTDFKYHGETYHVQTEDNGVNNPVVVTLLYFKGAILASKKTSYRDLLDKAAYQRDLMNLMKTQHKDLMHELLAGLYDGLLGATAPPPAAGAARTAPPSPAAGVAAADAHSSSPPAARPAVLTPTPAPHPAALALDQAIMRYLKEHAAATARGAMIPGR